MKLLSFVHFEGTFWGPILTDWGHSPTMESLQLEVCACKIAGGRYYTKNRCWEEEREKRERWCLRRANSPCAAAQKVAFISNRPTTPFNGDKDPSGFSGIRWWSPWSWRAQTVPSSLCLTVPTLRFNFLTPFFFPSSTSNPLFSSFSWKKQVSKKWKWQLLRLPALKAQYLTSCAIRW